jgi:methyl-accepting chemotaxis protein
MIGVGIAGIVTAVLGLIVSQILVDQVVTSVDDSLLLTNEALAAVDDSITVSASIVETVRDGIDSVQTTMDTVESSLDDTSTAINDSAEFIGGSLPTALDAIAEVLPTIESVASSIDDALRVLEQAPFGPDYDPVKPFDESIADLAIAIDPLPEQLRTLSTDFDALTSSTGAIADEVGQLGLDVAELESQLDNVARVLDRYTSTTADAQSLAAASREDLDESATLTRWLLVLLALVFGVGQIVPIWLGLSLLRDDSAAAPRSADPLVSSGGS